MSITDFTAPPRLAVGSHPNSKRYMCAMNVISWENGDHVITDYPSCTPRPLAGMVQVVNDAYCRHITMEQDPDTGSMVRVLCPPCSVKMLNLAHRTVHLPSLSSAGGWAWVADMLRTAQRAAFSVAEVDVLREAMKVALARAEGSTPRCPRPVPPAVATSGMTELAKQIVASQRALHPQSPVPVEMPSLSKWVPVGMTEEFVTFTPMPSPYLFKLLTGDQTYGEMGLFAPNVTPGAQYLPEHHYVRSAAELINAAGKLFVSGQENRKVMLDRAHGAINMWTRNTFRPTPEHASVKETVAA